MSVSSVGAMRARRRVGKAVRWTAESLEPRLLLAAVSWTGAGDGANWTDPNNWSTGALPGAADTVTINAAGSPTITIASGAQLITSLTTSDPLSIASAALLSVGRGIGGYATLTNSGTLSIGGIVYNPVVNRGLVTVAGQGNWIDGAFTAEPGSTLSLDDSGNGAGLSFYSGFTNDGTIALSAESSGGHNVSLTVGGTLTNAADGTITSSGSGADPLYLFASLTNKGTLTVQHSLTVTDNTTNADAMTGTISIAAGQTLNLFDTTLSLGSTVLKGTGTLAVGSRTVNLAADLTLSTAGPQVTFTNATVNGPSVLTNAAGNTLTLNNITVNASLINQGTVTVAGTTNTFGGPFTATTGSLLSIQANGNYAYLTISSGFTNDGTIDVSDGITNGILYGAGLTVSSGTLINATDGTITAAGPRADTGLGIVAALTNRGTLNVQAYLRLTGKTGPFDTTSGTVSITTGSVLAVSGTVVLGSTVLNGTGTLNAYGDQVELSEDQTLTADSVHLTLGVTVLGPGTLTNASGNTLALSNTTFNAPLINQGTVVVGGSGNAINGPFTASPGSALTLNDFGTTALTVSSGFTNDGTITFSSNYNSSNSTTLTVSSGTLTNAADGRIAASGTIADGLNVNGSLNNQGTVSVQSVNLTVQNPTNLSTNVLSGGAWELSGGGKLILPTAITTNAANLALSGAASIITDSSGTNNALSGLTNNSAGATLTLTGGQALAVTPATGTFTNDGTLTVGAGSDLSVNGAFVQNADGTFAVQIGGPTSANFGEVIASGNATAGGMLQASFVNTYDPLAAQTFAVLNGAGESGTFATVGGATPSGRTLLAQYNPTSALIAVAPLAPSTPVLTALSDTGISQSDGITNDNTPTFTGTALDGGTVQLYSDGALVGTAAVGQGGGAWSIQTTALPDGPHAITAALLDGNNDPGPSSAASSVLIDTAAPSSSVAALPAEEPETFTLSWSGHDSSGGSGVANYSVYLSDSGGAYVPLIQNTTSTSEQFTGQAGHTYGFYSVATDVAGNVQPTPTAAQAATTVVGPPTVTSITPGMGSPGGGTTVTVNGTGFLGATAVYFGSKPATAFTVNSAGTQITTVDPAGNGTVDVTVTTPFGTSPISAADQFVYFEDGFGWLAPGSAATWNASTHTLTVNGAATIINDPGTDEPNIVASGSAAELLISPATSPTDVHVGNISLSNGAGITMTSVGSGRSHSNHNVLVIGPAGASADPTVSIDSSSKLDLEDNDLIVHTGTSDSTGASELTAWRALAQTGRGVAPGSILDGTWTGNGLTSSAAAAADAKAGYEQNVLAVVLNSDQILGTDSKWTVGSSSETLGAHDILVKYTYNGDAALEGYVGDDSVTIVNGLYDGGKSTQADWAFGDFTGSGTVNDDDITILNGLYGNGTASSGLPVL